MVTNARSRFLRTSLVATAALAAAVAFAPQGAEARGGSSHGSSSHGSSGHGSSGHGGGGRSSFGPSHSGGSTRSHGGSSSSGSRFNGRHGGGRSGGIWQGGGRPGGIWRGSGHRRFGGGYYPYSWGWGLGWAPFYSSWWWGGSNVYVVTDGDGDGDGDGYADRYVDRNDGRSARGGRYAAVKTDVSPEEAQVFLDGKYIGTADDFDGRPDLLYLGPGKYHLEFRLPGYETLATDLDVSRGQRVRLDQKLKLAPGKSALGQFTPASKGTPLGRVFTAQGPAGRSTAADETDADGFEGDDDDDDAPPPPPRRIQQRAPAPRDDGWSDRGMGGRAPGPAPRERIRVPEDRLDVRDEPLPRHPGNRARMRFKVTPEDAAVYVDDKYLGAGEDLAANPRGVVTDPGTHSITVTRPGYKSKTVDVTVRIGSPVDVVVELEK